MVEGLVSISSRLTPLMADVTLLLDDSMAMPSMVYSALTGGLPALYPVDNSELPLMVMSVPLPVVCELITRREPLASVRTLALMPLVCSCVLIASRVCCMVAPAGIETL
ncbi:hypothetical protein D3C87_1874720 [compost metagenome]